ncbi:MAG: hypothetical protein M0D57_05890 [Sphingobacteriales bacterium JAD_PAG50586_3]|nr:MAG: hypothetical protein M0D57_05890 [Sphingobacteriales bacterium JAD_PAG50586_3]
MCLATSATAQPPPYNWQIQKVLSHNVQDTTFVFDTSTIRGKAKDYNIVNLTYLGKVTTRKGYTFKILTCLWEWNISQRATSRIVVYNDKNQYVGNYYMYSTCELPGKMTNGVLLFNIECDDCAKGTRFKLDLKKGLPQKFFLPCKGNYGDFYTFY